MECTYHPGVETSLRCSKCGKPICPKCMVQTPVGARCPDCAGLYKLPTYHVSTKYYLRAIGVGLGMAFGFGIAWGLIMFSVSFYYFNFLLAPGFGYAIGEVIGLSVNRKRGTGLAVIAGICLAISYLISIFLSLGLFHPFDLIALGLGIYVAITRLR